MIQFLIAQIQTPTVATTGLDLTQWILLVTAISGSLAALVKAWRDGESLQKQVTSLQTDLNRTNAKLEVLSSTNMSLQLDCVKKDARIEYLTSELDRTREDLDTANESITQFRMHEQRTKQQVKE